MSFYVCSSHYTVCLVLVAMLGVLSCESRQDDTAKTTPDAARPLSPTGTLTIPENSPILAQLRTERVTVRAINMELKAQAGKILANDNRLTHLSSRVPGRIVAVYANLGDHVKTGDRLLLLDSPELGTAQLEHRKAYTRLSLAEKSLERANLLLERKVIGTAEYQRREAEYQNALADAEQSDEHLHMLGMTEQDISRLRSGTLPHAQVAQVPLRASLSGEVIQRNATVGEVVDPSKILFTVADLSTVWVRADFPEQQAALLKVGLPIQVKVQAYPETTFTGRVTYVAAVVDPNTRTVMVRSDVPNPDGRLRPEMFADVTLVTDERPVLAVPRQAIQQEGAHTVVFVVRGPRIFERRIITVGPNAGGYAAVMTGLQDGEEVVTEGSYALKSEALREHMQLENPS